jgi:Subtilase family
VNIRPFDTVYPVRGAIESSSQPSRLRCRNGAEDYAVGSPATADAALSVGAVDHDDELAAFPSRGPRLGDDGIKPEITAPSNAGSTAITKTVTYRNPGTAAQTAEPPGRQPVQFAWWVRQMPGRC